MLRKWFFHWYKSRLFIYKAKYFLLGALFFCPASIWIWLFLMPEIAYWLNSLMDTIHVKTYPDWKMEVKYHIEEWYEEKKVTPSKLEEIKTICYTKLQALLQSL